MIRAIFSYSCPHTKAPKATTTTREASPPRRGCGSDVRRDGDFLDEYRRYANTERAHQGLDGRTPEEVSSAAPEAEVIDLAAVRSRRRERREYAHGLLHGYTLVEGHDRREAA